MKTIKRILAALLAAAVMLPMVACGEKVEKPSEGEQPSSVVESGTTTEGDNSNADLTEYFPDPSNPVTLSMFADINWLSFDSMEGGIVAEELKKKTGISIDMTMGIDGEQLKLMIASGDLPDLVCTYTVSSREQLSDERVCWPLKELQDKYTPNWQLSPEKQKLYALEADDGRYYALYNYYNTTAELEAADSFAFDTGAFYVRQDIYEELGAPAVKTKEDFYALMQSVKDNYPDMDPFVFPSRGDFLLPQLVGFDSGKPTDENGNYVHSLSDPKYKDYIKVVNEMYRQGFINEEVFSYNSDEQAMKGIGAGTTFMFAYFPNNSDITTFTPMVKANFPNAKFEMFPLLDTFTKTCSTYLDNGIFIPKSCTNPEAAIKFLCWASQPVGSYTLQYGVQGTDWDLDENGKLKVLDRYLEKNNAGTAEMDYKSYAYVFGVGDYIFDRQFYYATASEGAKKVYDDALSKIKWDNTLAYVYPKRDTPEREIRTDLSELISDYVTKLYIAKSDEEFDSLWADMMKEAENIGLADYNTWLQAEYEEQVKIWG
ncbi:MAG: hypothetical protein RSE93_02400 [Oscillospiraceae bacterium]